MTNFDPTFDYERALFFMKQAFREAQQAFEEGEVPIGSVVVKEGFVVGRGRNQTERLNDPTAHAEIIALGAASAHFDSWRLIDATIYSTIEPCVMCAGASVMARVRRIVYGAPDPKFGGCVSIFKIPTDTRLNHRVEVVGGVMADESAELMRQFFAREGRKTLVGSADMEDLAGRLLKLSLIINLGIPALLFIAAYGLRAMEILPTTPLVTAEILQILFYALLFVAVSEIGTSFIVKKAIFAPAKIKTAVDDPAAFSKLLTVGTLTLAAIGAASMVYGVVLYILGEETTKVAIFGLITLIHFRLFRPNADFLRSLVAPAS